MSIRLAVISGPSSLTKPTIVALIICFLSTTGGYFTTSTREKLIEERTIAVTGNNSKASVPLPATTTSESTGPIKNLKDISRLKRRLKSAIDKDCGPSTEPTDDSFSPPLVDDYVNLGLNDSVARRVNSDYKWSVVNNGSSAEADMNSFVDDYIQQFNPVSSYPVKQGIRKSTIGPRRRILNLVISDVTNDEKIVISNKNYTW